ncbi:MAG TPA: aldo/keto reductase [Acidimicrobiia bacterium]|nr:aldo/keto reductase [Acidimicrobiia bacterium]
MKYRTLGKTGFRVSEVGFGAWAIGGTWGEVSESDAMASLFEALDRGITFFDTADVYGDGHSERLIAKLRRERPEAEMVVATKAGRRLSPHVADGYNAGNLEAFIDRSRENLEMDTLDLLQLHCPPTEAYYLPGVFDAMDDLVASGKVRHYGVSVEKVEEALKAIEYPNVATVQIIFNMLRHRPAGLFFRESAARNVGVIARVPLASGVLTGKMSAESSFAQDDHRAFNRDGEAFDVGETFSGVPFEVALEAMEAIRPLVPEGATPAQFALRWILDHDAVSAVIPGGKNPRQVADNAAASDMDRLDDATMDRIAEIYEEYAAPHVHQRW